MLNWDDGQSTTRRQKHYGIHEILLVNSWTQLFLQNWSGNLIGAGAMQEHHVNFFLLHYYILKGGREPPYLPFKSLDHTKG